MAMLSVVLLGACKDDDDPGVRPVVTSTAPVSNATNIAINNKILATFSVEMNPSTLTDATFTLHQGSTSVSGAVVYAGTTASFIPTASLAINTLYTATLTTGVRSTAGTNMANNYSWSFTTGASPDITLPTVASSTPDNNATGVALNQAIVINFSEVMDLTTITASTFTLKQGATSVSGEVTYSGTAATFNPASDLEANKVYIATITTGASDMAGNALASVHVVSFTTAGAADLALPTVNSTGPVNNATNVALNKVIAITFSEEMDASTINDETFILMNGVTPVPGTVEYSGKTATFTPAVDLESGITYTATITAEAKDLAQNSLAAAISWSFTTGSSFAIERINLGTSGNYVILAETTVTNIATSNITGDLGLSPAATSFYTGFALTDATGYATSAQVTGKLYASNMADPTPINLTTAVSDMITAYNDAATRPTPDFSELATGSIGGSTLTPGLYKWTTTVSMDSDVTISGDGSDIWIFQISGDLTMDPGVHIILQGGAQAKNIFWQVAGQATLGTTTHFEGVILSMTAITFETGASMNGRALAQTAVILDQNVITKPQ